MNPFGHQTGMSRKESDHCRAPTQHNDEETASTKTQLTKKECQILSSHTDNRATYTELFV